MKIRVYEEGPWVYIAEADETDRDWIEVDDEIGKRWLETFDAWDSSVAEIRKKIH